MHRTWPNRSVRIPLVGLFFVLAACTARAGEPVRVFTVPNNAEGTVRSILSDRLGTAAASSAVQRPDGQSSTIAEMLPVIDSGARRYGRSTVSLYRLADEPVASALLDFARPVEAAAIGAGDDAWSSKDLTAVRSGAFTCVIEGGDRTARETLAAVVAERVGVRPIQAHLAKSLPPDGLIAGSARYAGSFESLRRFRPDLVADVFRLMAGGCDAVVADYEQGTGTPARMLLVEYHTPQLAGDAERSVAAYYDTLTPDAKAQRFVKREGNYLIEVTGALDPQALRARADSIEYAYGIKWIGEPEPTVLSVSNEARKAALVFVNSFAIVGLAFCGAIGCGLVVGFVVFRRRRRAAEAVFSDAGGMVHLDLGPGHLTRADPIGMLSEKSPS